MARPASAFEARARALPAADPDLSTSARSAPAAARSPGSTTALLQVGPRSAGAVPGPICYGRGGTEPTVTDAAVCLGYLDAAELPRRAMRLDDDAAAGGGRGSASPIRSASRSSTPPASVFDVLLARTVGRRAPDHRRARPRPATFSLLAFGGAGPLLASLLAREMGIGEVIVPADPAGFSAWGMLGADVVARRSRARSLALLDDVDASPSSSAVFAELEGEATGSLADARASRGDRRGRGMPARVCATSARSTRSCPASAERRSSWPTLRERVRGGCTARATGTRMDEPRCRSLNVRVRAIGRAASPRRPLRRVAAGRRRPVRARTGAALRLRHRQPIDVEFAVYERRALAPGDRCTGRRSSTREPRRPSSIATSSSTVDDYGHLLVTGGARDRAASGSTVRRRGHPQLPRRRRPSEMRATLVRTAFNPVIYEVLDFGISIYDADLELIAEAPGITLFLGRQRLRASARASSTSASRRLSAGRRRDC